MKTKLSVEILIKTSRNFLDSFTFLGAYTIHSKSYMRFIPFSARWKLFLNSWISSNILQNAQFTSNISSGFISFQKFLAHTYLSVFLVMSSQYNGIPWASVTQSLARPYSSGIPAYAIWIS